MTTPQEATFIRSQLKLRFNTIYGCYEVYTTIHGSGKFKWFKISEGSVKWYLNKFNVPVINPFRIDTDTGEMTSYNETPPEIDQQS